VLWSRIASWVKHAELLESYMTSLPHKVRLNPASSFWFRPGFANQKSKLITLSVSATTTILLMFVGFAVASVTTLAQEVKEKRKFDNRIPDHLPIKVKLKKEKEEAFQDLENPNWPEDFEVELQNTGTRPIYSISLLWTIWELKFSDKNYYGSGFRYGRNEFISRIGERPTAEDVPIQPGEVRTFKTRAQAGFTAIDSGSVLRLP